MKFLIISLLALLSLMTSSMAKAQVVYGQCVVQNTTLEELTCYGPADLTKTVVKGKLNVYGPLSLNNADVNTVDVKGPFHATASTIRGKASIFGSIEVINTEFLGDIFNAGNLMQLTKSSVKGDINIRADTQQPILELKDHSTIHGNVAFTLKEGIAKVSADSEIKGSVNNGKKEEATTETKTDVKPENKPENKPETKTENKAKN